MSQSKRMSFIESLTNVAVGYFVAVGSQIVIFPMFGVHCRLRDSFLMGLWFTVISIIRSYILRGWFNKQKEKTNEPREGAFWPTEESADQPA